MKKAPVQLTPEQFHAAIRLLASRGGKIRTKSMTPEQRTALARHAARVRWSKKAKRDG